MGEGFSIINLWHEMTFLAKFIACCMLVMSLWMVAVVIERWLTYLAGYKQNYQFVLQLRDHMAKRRLNDAIAAATVHQKSAIAKVMQAGLTEYVSGLEALRSKGPDDVGDFDIVDAVNRSLERVKERETANLRRRLGSLATIASVAPFVGLTGTVVGIMGAFQRLKGGGGMEIIGPSISEALIMTAFGLLIAIPAAMMFNYFVGRVEFFVVDMNDVASEFVDYVLKEGRAPAGGPAYRS
jgi:biopolymer transport protein ExbB/TolQ